MSEVFKQRPLPQQGPKHLFAVVLVAGPQDVMMGTGHVADGVDLDESNLSDAPHHVDWPNWRIG